MARTSARSRVNFSKLSTDEKEVRCLNLAKEIKMLRRKVRRLEEKLLHKNSKVNSAQMSKPENQLLMQA